jgi:creatinine amidohydrolase/Fe(II)-dependent formamide hydrolase-like protein
MESTEAQKATFANTFYYVTAAERIYNTGKVSLQNNTFRKNTLLTYNSLSNHFPFVYLHVLLNEHTVIRVKFNFSKKTVLICFV